MKEELYKQALSFFNNGDYEKALNILKQEENQLSSIQEKQLFKQCKKQITEQYYYLINDSIRQEDYLNANALKEEYKTKYGDNPRIANLVIPKKEVSASFQHSTEPEIDENESSARSTQLWLIIGSIVVVGFIGFLYWQYNNNNSPANSNQGNTLSIQDKEKTVSYEERSEAIISQLTGEYGNQVNIIGKYPNLSQYIAFVYRKDWKDCLIFKEIVGNQRKEFCFPLRIGNSSRCGIPTKAFDSKDKSKILIIGENGGNEFAYMAFLLEYNPLTDEVRELGWGLNLEEQEDWIKITRRWTTFWDEESFNHEYAFIDIYYDFNGKLIPSLLKGESYQFKGKIDNKYAVTMQLSIWNDKIYGEYYYDRNGSENVLYLYGGISSGQDIVLLEFNDKGEQTSTFNGKFGRDSFSGTFVNYQNKEMSFELLLSNGSSSSNEQQTESNNYQSAAALPDQDAEFPGGMIGLGEYITENMQYPAIAQENGVSGNVRVSYIIDENGSVTDAEVIESVDPYLDKEAVRLISSMPKWKPGVRDGRYVKMKTSTVIRFELK